MKKLAVTLLVLALSSQALADCRPAYGQALDTLGAQIRGERGNTLAAGATSGISSGIMVAVGFISPPTMILTGTSFFVSFIRGRILSHRYKTLKFVQHVIDESYEGQGPHLDKVIGKLHKKHVDVTPDELAPWIVAANEANLLCAIDDETGRLTLSGDKQVFRMALKDATENKPENSENPENSVAIENP
jgi:hypothetical protein